jgi:hypothetical protein
MTLGQTTLDTVGRLLNQNGIYLQEATPPAWSPNGWTAYAAADSSLTLSNGVLSTEVDFVFQDGILDTILINSGGYSIDFPPSPIPEFKKIWKNFAPETLIPELGIPSRVELITAPLPGEGPITGASHTLFVFYQDRGILLQYSLTTGWGTGFPLCPTFGSGGNAEDAINVFLNALDNQIPIEKYNGAYFADLSMNLQDAAGLTVEDFYNLFMQTDKPPCFRLLPNAFPHP